MEFVHVLSVSTTIVLATVSPAAHSTVLDVLTISVLIAEIDILRVSVALQLAATVLQVLTEIPLRILLSALTAPSQTVALAPPLLVPYASLVLPRQQQVTYAHVRKVNSEAERLHQLYA